MTADELGVPVELRDGSRVRIRQGHRTDRELLVRGFEHLARSRATGASWPRCTHSATGRCAT